MLLTFPFRGVGAHSQVLRKALPLTKSGLSTSVQVSLGVDPILNFNRQQFPLKILFLLFALRLSGQALLFPAPAPIRVHGVDCAPPARFSPPSSRHLHLTTHHSQ